jgi:hypothetical protein
MFAAYASAIRTPVSRGPAPRAPIATKAPRVPPQVNRDPRILSDVEQLRRRDRPPVPPAEAPEVVPLASTPEEVDAFVDAIIAGEKAFERANNTHMK